MITSGHITKNSPAGQPRFFTTQTSFRSWLEKKHGTAKEVLVGFHRRNSGKGGYPGAKVATAHRRFGGGTENQTVAVREEID